MFHDSGDSVAGQLGHVTGLGKKVVPTGLFRVRGIIHPPGISLLDGPILKPFEVVTVNSPGFCLVYLDGLCVGNYPSKICQDFWTGFRT